MSKARWYKERRESGDEMVVAWNEDILRFHRANHDISFVGNVAACAASEGHAFVSEWVGKNFQLFQGRRECCMGWFVVG